MDHILQMDAASANLHIVKVEQNMIAAASALAIHAMPLEQTEANNPSLDLRCPEMECKLERLLNMRSLSE